MKTLDRKASEILRGLLALQKSKIDNTDAWALLTSVLFMIKQMAVVHTITATMTWMAAASAL